MIYPLAVNCDFDVRADKERGSVERKTLLLLRDYSRAVVFFHQYKETGGRKQRIKNTYKTLKIPKICYCFFCVHFIKRES